MSVIAARLVVHGRVQGVGYRWWAVRQAQALGLGGWVRNRRDGTVELLAIGAEAACAALAQACARGPDAAVVSAVERFDAEDDGSRDFTEAPTV